MLNASNSPTAQPLEPSNPHPHLVLPPLDQPANRRAHAHGTIHKVYPHGIQFIDQMSEAAGIMAMGCGAGALASFAFFLELLHSFGPTDWFTWWAFVMTMFSLAFARLDFVGYRYQPVLFNRAAGKVHVFLDEGTKFWEVWRWFGLTRHSIHTYDWACVRGEVAELTVLGSGDLPRKEMLLMLAFTEAPGSNRVVARVGVGYTDMYVGTEAAVQRFEHIRRYMQHQGPPLAPGDHLYEDQSKLSLWAALTWGQPLIGPGSLGYWTGSAVNGAWFLSIPFGVLCLTILPLTVPGGLLRALSHWTKTEPKWPPEILASVGGASLSRNEVAQFIQPEQTLRRRPPPDSSIPTPVYTLKQKRAAEKERKQRRGKQT
jgi:hypothetical protein